MGTYYGGFNTINDLADIGRIELPSYIDATALPFNSIAIDKANVYGDSKMKMAEKILGTCQNEVLNQIVSSSRIELTTKENKEKKEKEYVSLDVRRIIKNGPATIVFWEDNTKTVVVRKKGEKDNLYYAFCAALAKRIYGNNSQVNKIVKSIVDETKKTSKKEKK